jgi:hypothetical protein
MAWQEICRVSLMESVNILWRVQFQFAVSRGTVTAQLSVSIRGVNEDFNYWRSFCRWSL